jgi:hypothetical protein
MNLLLLLLLFFAAYFTVKSLNYAIDYYDFAFSIKAKKKACFTESIERRFPLLGDIAMSRYTIIFKTDKFHAPKIGEYVRVCGIEYRCIDLTDLSDLDDHLIGNPIYEVCLFKEDY